MIDVNRQHECFMVFLVGFMDATGSIRKMLPCLWRAFRPTLTLRTGICPVPVRGNSSPIYRNTTSGIQVSHLGTHPMKEPMEPLTSPDGARDFIYSLHPTERTCLLRELHRFESIAMVQGMEA